MPLGQHQSLKVFNIEKILLSERKCEDGKWLPQIFPQKKEERNNSEFKKLPWWLCPLSTDIFEANIINHRQHCLNSFHKS